MDSSNTPTLTDVEAIDPGIQKQLTLTFRNVNVHVTASDAALGDNLLSVADPRQFFNGFFKSQRPSRVGVPQSLIWHI